MHISRKWDMLYKTRQNNETFGRCEGERKREIERDKRQTNIENTYRYSLCDHNVATATGTTTYNSNYGWQSLHR